MVARELSKVHKGAVTQSGHGVGQKKKNPAIMSYI
jgi:hypothetical protein